MTLGMTGDAKTWNDGYAAGYAQGRLSLSADLDRLRALATLGASLQHLHGLGILERHHGKLDECTTQRCVDARAALGDRAAEEGR